MNIENQNPFGTIVVNEAVLTEAAREAALSCYGVVSIAPQPSSVQFLNEMFGIEPKPGVVAVKRTNGWHVSLYLNVIYGLKLTEIITAVQDQVKYILEKTFDIKFKTINIYIVGVETRN